MPASCEHPQVPTSTPGTKTPDSLCPRSQLLVDLQRTMVAQLGPHASLQAAFKADDRVALNCLVHDAAPLRLGSILARYKKGQLLCRKCQDSSTAGAAEKQKITELRIARAVSKRGEGYQVIVAPKILEACGKFGIELAQGSGLKLGRVAYFNCLQHSSKDPFKVGTPSSLLLAKETPCPHCRADARILKPWLRWARDPELRATVFKVRRGSSAWAEDGGYLYQIVDSASNKKYIGLTTLSPEVRWEGHLKETPTSDKPLYRAMRERPDDFRLESLAFYKTKDYLRQAERAAILSQNTVWPNGYNVSKGGETGTLESDKDILDYAIRQGLNSVQVTHLLNWATWCPTLDLSRAGLARRLVANLPYGDLIRIPAQKDRPLMVGGVRYESMHDACVALGWTMTNVAPNSSEGGVSVPTFLEFIYHLKNASGPWRIEQFIESTLEDLRVTANVSFQRLLQEMHQNEDGNFDRGIVEVLTDISGQRGERVQGVLYLTRSAACDAHRVKLPTVLGQMHRTQCSFEEGVLLAQAKVKGRVYVRKQVVRTWTGNFVFQGKTYSSPNNAAEQFGIRSNTFSYWRARYSDPAKALQACLDTREGLLKKNQSAMGPREVQVRGVRYAGWQEAAERLNLNWNTVKEGPSKPGFCRESILEFLLRVAEGAGDASLDAILSEWQVPMPRNAIERSPDNYAWYISVREAVRCARLSCMPSPSMKAWLLAQFTQEPELKARLDSEPELAELWGTHSATLRALAFGVSREQPRSALPFL